MVNGGYLLEPYVVSEIVDSEGNVVQQNARTVVRQVISEETSATMRQIIESVVTEGTAKNGSVVGYRIGGKTGTAENPRGRDHSTFLSFAPKDNPKIAISVYVENGGFGASAALPIASLLEEYYLTDTIRRPELLQYIKDMNIYYPAYDK